MQTTEEVELCKNVGEYHADYKVLYQIASGAFGSVHAVQHKYSKAIQAAKYTKQASADVAREVYALRELAKSSLILRLVDLYQNSREDGLGLSVECVSSLS